MDERTGEENLVSEGMDLAGIPIEQLAAQVNRTTAKALAIMSAFLYNAAKDEAGLPMQMRNNHGRCTAGHRDITWGEYHQPNRLAYRYLSLIADAQYDPEKP